MSDVFNSDQEGTQTQITADQPQPQEPSLSMIGDGKKYADVLAADKALTHSQTHIDKIQGENEALRNANEALKVDLDKAKTVEDVLAKLNTVDEHDTELPSVNQNQPLQESLKTEDVKDILSSMLTKEKQQEVASQNRAEVSKHLTEKFGEKAAAVVAKRQEELGIDIQQLAEVSPKAALEFFNNVTDVPMTSLQSTISTNEGFKQETGDYRQSEAYIAAAKDASPEGYATMCRIMEENS